MNGKSIRSPLYIQLREILRSKIEDGEYPPGTCIPSESQLAEAYGLTRVSVRSALGALEYEGLLKSVQGKGVFVSGPKVERDMETLGGFRQTMRDRAQHPSTKVLVKAVRKAGPYYALMLGVRPEDDVWFVRRVNLADGEPVALDEIYIPAAVVPNFADVDIELFSIYDAYEWNGVRPVRGEQTLSVTRLDPAAARLIGLDGQDAVLAFSCVTCDRTGRIIEFARSYTRNDKCEFIVHFAR
jgi:GntR family transcriptional regulator